MRKIAAIANPVIRNLEITYCYSRLAAAFAARSGEGANWCTYATWASRQAGRTIRGEDLLEQLERSSARPLAAASDRDAVARLLRRGLFQRETRIGRLTAELHTPFDAFERASDAVARGNLKVFEEIGLEFARYLEECPPDARPSHLVPAFPRPAATRRPARGTALPTPGVRAVRAPAARARPKTRAELAVLANLEIGLHEQTRLQPEIREALDAAYATQEDLGRRALEALFPSAARWWSVVRRPATAVVGVVAAGAQRSASRLAREVITEFVWGGGGGDLDFPIVVRI